MNKLVTPNFQEVKSITILQNSNSATSHMCIVERQNTYTPIYLFPFEFEIVKYDKSGSLSSSCINNSFQRNTHHKFYTFFIKYIHTMHFLYKIIFMLDI